MWSSVKMKPFNMAEVLNTPGIYVKPIHHLLHIWLASFSKLHFVCFFGLSRKIIILQVRVILILKHSLKPPNFRTVWIEETLLISVRLPILRTKLEHEIALSSDIFFDSVFQVLILLRSCRLHWKLFHFKGKYEFERKQSSEHANSPQQKNLWRSSDCSQHLVFIVTPSLHPRKRWVIL